MNSFGQTKNARRPTETQMLVLLDFMEKHPALAIERGTRNLRPLWVKISRQLNSMPQGAVKSTSAWRKCWSDKKSHFRQAVDPNGPDPPKQEEDFTDIERRMVALGVLRRVHKSEEGSTPSKDYPADQDDDSTTEMLGEDEEEPAPPYPRYRPTETQTSMLLDYLERHPQLIAARRRGRAALWDEVAAALNGVPGGARKNPVAWMKYWSDKKTNFRHAVFGTNPGVIPMRSESDYSDLEKRMVALGVLDVGLDGQPQSTSENEDSMPMIERLEEFNDEDESSAAAELLIPKEPLPFGRINTPRATKEQQRMLLGYLERFPMLAESPRKFRPMWGRIAQRLNALPNAPRKSIDTWIKFWADKRTGLRKLVASGNHRALVEIERRMVALGVLNGTDRVSVARRPLPTAEQEEMVLIKVEPMEENSHPANDFRPVTVKGEEGRTRFPTAAQKRALVALWRRRPPLSWLEVAARLNAMRPGCVRDAEEWRQYWSEASSVRSSVRRAAVKVEAARTKRERSLSDGDQDPISTAAPQDGGSASGSEAEGGAGAAAGAAAGGGDPHVYLCGELPPPGGAAGDSAPHVPDVENELDIGAVCWHQGAGGLARRVSEAGAAREAALAQCMQRIQEAHENWQREAHEVLRAQAEAAARATEAAVALADAARAQQAAAEALAEMASEQRRAASEQAAAILEAFRRLAPVDGDRAPVDGDTP